MHTFADTAKRDHRQYFSHSPVNAEVQRFVGPDYLPCGVPADLTPASMKVSADDEEVINDKVEKTLFYLGYVLKM